MRYWKYIEIKTIHLFIILFTSACAQNKTVQVQGKDEDPALSYQYYDSGGTPIKEQLYFDVTYYDLNLTVKPDEKWIGGNLAMMAHAIRGIDTLILHLDTLLEVTHVELEQPFKESLQWKRSIGLISMYPSNTIPQGTYFTVRIHYSGNPLTVEDAKRRSWSDGFYFEKTPGGQPWVSNVSVLNGADIWWPCKDHPSDEPDSMALNITIEKNLVVATNGRLRNISINDDSTMTFKWFASNPINNYAVSINIAPYKLIETEYTSVTGDIFPFQFYVIPEHYEVALSHFKYFQDDMRFLETTLGPYPFRADKYGVAETFYFGMETQSIIAYGNDFTLNEFGFDYLHFHELAHEWFANMVTAEDWKHWWIHESFATYLESLYAEYLGGKDAYFKYMERVFSRVQNKTPIVLSKEYVSAREGYISDVYSKGACVLHTLRFLLGKEKMIKALRKMAYPKEALEQITDGRQTRLSNTGEFQKIAEEQFGDNLDWFFDTYLYYAEVPKLLVYEINGRVDLEWQTGSGYPFILSVPVTINQQVQIIEMTNGKGSFEVRGNTYEIDPRNEILKEIQLQGP